jgi:hypothetical protein
MLLGPNCPYSTHILANKGEKLAFLRIETEGTSIGSDEVTGTTKKALLIIYSWQ